MIDCQNVTKHFGDLAAVDNISFQIAGGICALLGPNGAGKSTLLKLLTGLIAPDHGSIRVAGLDVTKESLPLKRIIGVVPEDLGLFDSLSIAEHLALCGPIYGLDKKQVRERTDALLRTLALEDGRNTFLSRCSHGMRKKTALAMALLHNPRVLFLDEPFEGIDPVSSRTIRDLLRRLADRGTTVFLTSHTLSLVEQMADEIMMIRGGRIVLRAPAASEHQKLEDLYFTLIEPLPLEDLPWLEHTRS